MPGTVEDPDGVVALCDEVIHGVCPLGGWGRGGGGLVGLGIKNGRGIRLKDTGICVKKKSARPSIPKKLPARFNGMG